MKKRRYILLYAGLLTLLIACQKAPDEVLENIKTGDKTVEKDTDVDHDTLENIYETINQVKSNTYDNLTFTSDFTINMPESIGLLTLKQTEGFYENNRNLIETFVNKINPDVEIETDVFPTGMQYRDFEGKEFFSISDNGFFCHEKHKYDNWLNIENGDLGDNTLVDEILLRKKYSDQTYEWENNTFTLNDIVETATIYGNDLSSTYDVMDWIPENIQIYQHTSDEFFFRISFTKSYHDVHLFYSEWGNYTSAMKEHYVQVYQPVIVIDSSLEVTFVDNYPGIIEYVDTKETYDKIITLEYAAEALSSLLSSYRKYEVQWISLEYRLVYETDDGSDEMMRTTAYVGKMYETRPCCTFYLKNDLDNPAFATVDCVTGEIEFVSSN